MSVFVWVALTTNVAQEMLPIICSDKFFGKKSSDLFQSAELIKAFAQEPKMCVCRAPLAFWHSTAPHKASPRPAETPKQLIYGLAPNCIRRSMTFRNFSARCHSNYFVLPSFLVTFRKNTIDLHKILINF